MWLAVGPDERESLLYVLSFISVKWVQYSYQLYGPLVSINQITLCCLKQIITVRLFRLKPSISFIINNYSIIIYNYYPLANNVSVIYSTTVMPTLP